MAVERGISVLELYEHMKKFLTTASNHGGSRRDAMRAELKAHYSTATKSFSRSFVVGPLNDCCAASAALANGISFQTFANARADLRADRPARKKRKQARKEKASYARTTIETYIRRQLRADPLIHMHVY